MTMKSGSASVNPLRERGDEPRVYLFESGIRNTCPPRPHFFEGRSSLRGPIFELTRIS